MTTAPSTTSTKNYPGPTSDQHDDEDEEVDEKEDEGRGRTILLNATSTMRMIPQVSLPSFEDNVMIFPQYHEEDNDDNADGRGLVVTMPRKNNNNDDPHDYFIVPVNTEGGVLVKQGQPTNNKKMKKTTKRVSIDERVHVRPTLARTDISPQERHAAWYSMDEYKEITEQCCKQVKRLNRGEILKDKKYCARGLESYTQTRCKLRKLNRLLAYEALWEEEERQTQSGIHNEEALARVYCAVSSSCQLWARAVALEDQKEADNIVHSS